VRTYLHAEEACLLEVVALNQKGQEKNHRVVLVVRGGVIEQYMQNRAEGHSEPHHLQQAEIQDGA